jgi:hypothetical protein
VSSRLLFAREIPHPSDKPSSPRPEEHQAKFVIATELSPTDRIVFDSGCSISGTFDVNNLAEIRPCGSLQVSGAFEPPTQPSQRGKYGPLGLDAIVLPGLGAQTLVYLSQFCEGGDTGVHYVGVFTHVDFRMFRTDSVLPALRGCLLYRPKRYLRTRLLLTSLEGRYIGH